MKDVQLTVDGLVLGADVHANATAGSGGDGAGKKGAGGIGGDASFVNINAAGDVALIAGDGGEGTLNSVSGTTVVHGGAPGRGGNIQISGVFARMARANCEAKPVSMECPQLVGASLAWQENSSV
jgi:hypothetical protein